MNDWDIQQKVEAWCRAAWNNMGLGALQGEIQKLRGEIARCNQEMANARTASTTAVSAAKQAVANAEAVVKDVAARMDELEDEQVKFSEVVKEAKENADKALAESEKKNQPIVIKTGGGWDYSNGEWTTCYSYGSGSYGMSAAVNVAAQLQAQGVTVSAQVLQQILTELDNAKDKLVVEQDNYNRIMQETKDANN